MASNETNLPPVSQDPLSIGELIALEEAAAYQ